MNNTKAMDFLKRYGMDAAAIDVADLAKRMLAGMEYGLANKTLTMPMIPTYVKIGQEIPNGVPVAVIDAGGTNYRSALVTIADGDYTVEHLEKRPMPGVGTPVDWDEFITFVADSIMPLMDKADSVGFCFSYPAEVTPEIDGRVIRFTKEVNIRGAEGKLVAAAVKAELEKRGVTGKKIVILNDTVAVLLGGSALIDRSACGGFIGQVSGTGANTCCILPMNKIPKLGTDDTTKILINLESGSYMDMEPGHFDQILDAESKEPGKSRFEKMTAGVYLGELCRLMLKAAAEEGLLSEYTAQKARELGTIDSAVIDAWASGERLDEISDNEDDAGFASTLSYQLIERSAKCMCACITAELMLTGEGKDSEKPVCVLAEGSLVQKSRHFRPVLEQWLESYTQNELGLHATIRIGQDTTLLGSAAAALFN